MCGTSVSVRVTRERARGCRRVLCLFMCGRDFIDAESSGRRRFFSAGGDGGEDSVER